MSYKPTTGVSINDNDFKLVTSEAVYEALQLKQDVITPGDVDKVLASDGSALTWQYAGLGAGNFGIRNAFLGRSKPVNRTTAVTCLAIGEGALNSVTTGSNNLAIGYNALQSVTTGVNNFVLGINAGLALTTNQCTMIGHSAGRTNATGANVVYVGFETAQYNTGASNTALGFRALRGVSPSSSGSNNVVIGTQAAQSASTNSLVVIGQGAGIALTTGGANILIGPTAGDAITTGTSNTIIGDIAGSTTLASTMIFAAGTAERFRVDSSGNMGIGTSTPTKKLEVAGAVKADEFTVTRGGGEVYRLDPHTHDEGTETTDFTINWSNGSVHSVTLNAAGPLVITMSNPVDGGAYALRIIQGATPGTVTWPASVKWPGGTPPTLSTGTGDVDVVNLLYYADTGFYYATFALDFA